MKNITESINESSLSRIWAKTKDNDSGAITADRGSYSNSENQGCNKKLLALLMNCGFSVTKVKGAYIEDYGTDKAKEVGETSFVVVDDQKIGGLKEVLIKAGKHYEQDSILWVPQGGKAVLVGTNKADFPGLGKEVEVGKAKWGDADGPFFSRVNGRKFAFESVEEAILPNTRNGKWAMHLMAEELKEEMKN